MSVVAVLAIAKAPQDEVSHSESEALADKATESSLRIEGNVIESIRPGGGCSEMVESYCSTLYGTRAKGNVGLKTSDGSLNVALGNGYKGLSNTYGPKGHLVQRVVHLLHTQKKRSELNNFS